MVRQNRLVAVVAALMLSAGIADAQTQVKSGFNLFSAEQDVQIGQQSAAQAEQQFPLMRDSEVEAYVNRIGQKLAANAGGPRFPYTFKIVNASDINAFALPGGPIYINRGVIDNARNEGEVAGVIAHEIAHVALRHGTHQASKAYAAQAGISILGGLLGGRIGQNTAQILNTVGGLGLNVLFLRFSRELETAADVRGAQILAASGYSPQDMVGFFQTLSRVDTARKTNFLSDHPAPPDRINRIQKEARMLSVRETPTTNVAGLQEMQSRMKSRYGNAPTMAQIARSGPQSGSANRPQTSASTATGVGRVEAPSRSLSSFTSRSGVYRVSYPANWRVYEEGSTGVTIAPNGGIGEAGGRTEVVYGAMINHYDPFGAARGSRFRSGGRSDSYGDTPTLESATSDLVAQIRQGSQHLSPVSGSTQKFNLDGGRALAVSLRGTNPNTRVRERVTVVTRALGDGHLVYLLFVTPDAESKNYAPVLQAMVNSLQVDDARRH